MIVLTAGCSLKARETLMYHSFDYRPPAAESAVPYPETLMVYRFLLDPAVNIYSLMVSDSKGGEESMLFHRWRDNPADMITELVLRDIQTSGLFEKAVDQLSNARYRYALEGTIRRLEGVAKDGKFLAVIEAEAALMDFDPPRQGQKTIMKQSYKVEAPSKDPNAESVVRALNLAVQELSAKIRGDIKAAMEKEAPTGGKRIKRKAGMERLEKEVLTIYRRSVGQLLLNEPAFNPSVMRENRRSCVIASGEIPFSAAMQSQRLATKIASLRPQ
jgi:ABC-type uncharacterized transport system auxiliary subunit